MTMDRSAESQGPEGPEGSEGSEGQRDESDEPRARPRPPLAYRLSLSAVSLLVMAIGLELGARLLVAAPSPVLLREGVYVSQLPMVSGRDTVHRVEGPPLPVDKRPGEARVFVFGESSVEGAPWDYPGSPATMLADQLRASMPGREVTVVNMGRSASMTRDAYYYLATIERFRPDVVVFYQGMNDEFHTDPELCMPLAHPYAHGAWRWMVEHSRFLWSLRALGPARITRLTGRRYDRPKDVPPDRCERDAGFRAWAEVLVSTARKMGAEVLVTTVVQNPLRAYETFTPWGVDQALSVSSHDEGYRRLLACALTEGCDLADAVEHEQKQKPRTNDSVRQRGEIWKAAAAAHGAHVVDFEAYVRERTRGGFSPPMFTEEVHLSLEGYWRLAWLWAEALRPLLGAPGAGPSPEPPALDGARYLEAITRDASQSTSCILLHCANTYLRMGMPLVSAPLLRSAATADRPATSRAAMEAQLFAGSLRASLSLDPALPPSLASRLGDADLARMTAELREHRDCSTVGPFEAAGPGASPEGHGREPEGPAHVLLPGQEETIGAMLGMGARSMGGCKLEGASIDRSFVRASYRCQGDAPAVLELRHPSEQVVALAATERFVLVASQPPPPRELAEAVAQSVRAREAGVRWSSPAAAPPQAPARPSAWPRVALLALIAAAVAALAWARARRARRARRA